MNMLKAKDLSKLYRIGEFGFSTLKADLARWWVMFRGGNDPRLQISEKNSRGEDNQEYIWAIKEINFSLERGTTLGVLGKNGAGKSTLLKIISQITKPTTGKVYLNGSVSSLLEVGTGFDGALTGLENIYLSGAILGMDRHEINHFREDIIEFSGLRRFMSTPIIRYSSGMYLRLAFSVAAHLQSDILILDEILAVGDYEFRRKAIEHLRQVAKGQRTIIYVAHQLETLRHLCDQGIVLEGGRLTYSGKIQDAIQFYSEGKKQHAAVFDVEKPRDAEKVRGYIQRLSILDGQGNPCEEPPLNDVWQIRIDFLLNEHLDDFRVSLRTQTSSGLMVNVTQTKPLSLPAGHHVAFFLAKGFHLGTGSYFLTPSLSTKMETFEHLENKAILQIAPAQEDEETLFIEPQALIASPFDTDLVSATEKIT